MTLNFDTKPFREALGAFTTGVTIVTTRDSEGNDVGLTANSFNSVSLDPPLVLWSLSKSSLSLRAFKTSDHFAVHILAVEQETLSDLFAMRGADKFAGLELNRGAGNVPLLANCSARFECEKAFEYEGGDHEIFVGQVIDFQDYGKAPLVFQAGKYALAIQKPRRSGVEPSPVQANGSFGKDSLLFNLSVAHRQIQSILQPGLDELGIDEAENGVLMCLLVRDGRGVVELEHLLSYMGRRLPDNLLQALVLRGLVTISADKVFLTDTGRRLSIRIMAMTKAVEEDAEEALGYGEKELLRQFLTRIIRSSTDPEQEKLWGQIP